MDALAVFIVAFAGGFILGATTILAIMRGRGVRIDRRGG